MEKSGARGCARDASIRSPRRACCRRAQTGLFEHIGWYLNGTELKDTLSVTATSIASFDAKREVPKHAIAAMALSRLTASDEMRAAALRAPPASTNRPPVRAARARVRQCPRAQTPPRARRAAA
jgi:hypothetical protein